MKDSLEFKACRFLDFEDNYTAKKQAIMQGKETKVFWLRPLPYLGAVTMVQFCSQRGRLNGPEACLCKNKAHCSYYDEVLHVVENISD